MFAAVDPIPMVQLMNILGEEYVVWDKAAEIQFKRPAREHLYAEFTYSFDEIEDIKNRIMTENEITITKRTALMNKEKTQVFCEVKEISYVADYSFYKNKRAKSKSKT